VGERGPEKAFRAEGQDLLSYVGRWRAGSACASWLVDLDDLVHGHEDPEDFA
jgi:hypothetical protein